MTASTDLVGTDLASQQQRFMAQVLDETAPVPESWGARQAAGMDIYRNAYRARLVDALRDTYERTARYVGEDAFRQAAAHHLITRPPNSWTLDDAGAGFADCLLALFAQDPEVAELGWLEWAMHCAFVAADKPPLDAAGFATATALFDEHDWENMRLRFLPGTSLRPVRHDIAPLWRALQDDAESAGDVVAGLLEEPLTLVVWREGLKPVFMQVDRIEGEAIALVDAGATYGEVCAMLVSRLGEEQAVARAGEMLGRWLHNGLVAEVSQG